MLETQYFFGGKLLTCRYKDVKGIYQLNFTRYEVRVCKSYYFKTTGLNEKLFNMLPII